MGLGVHVERPDDGGDPRADSEADGAAVGPRLDGAQPLVGEHGGEEVVREALTERRPVAQVAPLDEGREEAEAGLEVADRPLLVVGRPFVFLLEPLHQVHRPAFDERKVGRVARDDHLWRRLLARGRGDRERGQKLRRLAQEQLADAPLVHTDGKAVALAEHDQELDVARLPPHLANEREELANVSVGDELQHRLVLEEDLGEPARSADAEPEHRLQLWDEAHCVVLVGVVRAQQVPEEDHTQREGAVELLGRRRAAAQQVVSGDAPSVKRRLHRGDDEIEHSTLPQDELARRVRQSLARERVRVVGNGDEADELPEHFAQRLGVASALSAGAALEGATRAAEILGGAAMSLRLPPHESTDGPDPVVALHAVGRVRLGDDLHAKDVVVLARVRRDEPPCDKQLLRRQRGGRLLGRRRRRHGRHLRDARPTIDHSVVGKVDPPASLHVPQPEEVVRLDGAGGGTGHGHQLEEAAALRHRIPRRKADHPQRQVRAVVALRVKHREGAAGGPMRDPHAATPLVSPSRCDVLVQHLPHGVGRRLVVRR
mmetsp:Transcript_23774/g.70339  ORF Transcript_23774/g.70339 Transcript_23774/m.70339 type:complete len:544 (+) Transcript_23774:4120-5751(+)